MQQNKWQTTPFARSHRWPPPASFGRSVARWKWSSLLLLLVLLLAGVFWPASLAQADESATTTATTSKAVASSPSSTPKSDPTQAKASTQISSSSSGGNERSTPTTTSTTSEIAASKTANKKRTNNKPDHNKASGAGETKQEHASKLTKAVGGNKKCDYDRGQWQACEPDGSQRKVMRLKAGHWANCKPTKTIRRDCRTGEVGCKYARGAWSSVCQDGQRVRIDTLVGLVESDGSERDFSLAQAGESPPAAARCKPQRRVTKDCGRTCHYVKSAWSECSLDGFRTRLLTLEEDKPAEKGQETTRGANVGTRASLVGAAGDNRQLAVSDAEASAAITAGNKQRPKRTGDNQICARQKLIRRECRANSKLASNLGQLQQQQQPNAQTGPNGSGASNMKQIQRRRLKQIQLKQPISTQTRAGPSAGLATTAATTTTVTQLGSSAKPGLVRASLAPSQSVTAAATRPAMDRQAN